MAWPEIEPPGIGHRGELDLVVKLEASDELGITETIGEGFERTWQIRLW
jgi:hypothetical protein